MAKLEYKREFFDRSYSAGDAYRRVWKYARRYWFRLFVGIVCGMLTAGTLVPVFQIVQPALQHVESHDSQVEAAASMEADGGPEVPDMAGERPVAAKPKNSFEKEIAKRLDAPKAEFEPSKAPSGAVPTVDNKVADEAFARVSGGSYNNGNNNSSNNNNNNNKPVHNNNNNNNNAQNPQGNQPKKNFAFDMSDLLKAAEEEAAKESE